MMQLWAIIGKEERTVHLIPNGWIRSAELQSSLEKKRSCEIVTLLKKYIVKSSSSEKVAAIEDIIAAALKK